MTATAEPTVSPPLLTAQPSTEVSARRDVLHSYADIFPHCPSRRPVTMLPGGLKTSITADEPPHSLPPPFEAKT